MIHSDEHWMQRAIALGKSGEFTARPNPCVGAVIVKDNNCLGEGAHWQAGLAHAEVNAIADAAAKGLDVTGATCYVTLEPCSHFGRTPPCVNALIAAGIRRVVIASLDPNPLVNGRGIDQLRAAGMEVIEGILSEEANAMNPGFFSRIVRKRPWVRGKMAMSLDGRTAMKSGESQWITSESARADGHRWRARSGAVITTAISVIKDNARMTVRAHLPDFPEGITFRQPLRVILDKDLSLPPTASILHQEGESLVVINEAITVDKQQAFLNHVGTTKVQLLALPLGAENHLDLAGLWEWLYQHDINEVLVEAGATFVGAMLQAKQIDEMLVYIAPKCLGHEGMPMIVLPGLERLDQHIAGQFQEITAMEPDIRLRVTL